METIYNQDSYRLKLIDELESLRKTISLLKIQISAIQVSDQMSSLNNQDYKLFDNDLPIIKNVANVIIIWLIIAIDLLVVTVRYVINFN